MGNPLAPGLYYVAITNLGSRPATYTVTSRGIGPGFSVPVRDLPFEGGSDAQSLAPREAAWYRVAVPTNAPAWKIRMTADAGEALLLAQRGALPNLGAHPTNGVGRPLGGRLLRKLGSEHLLNLPRGGTNTALPGGTYYLGVVSEGWVSQQPRPPRHQPIADHPEQRRRQPAGLLGRVGTTDLMEPAMLAGGESDTWRFEVPEGTRALEAWLPASEGAPTHPHPRPVRPRRHQLLRRRRRRAVPLGIGHGHHPAQPRNPGTYSLTAQAGPNAGTFADARLEVRVRALPISDLNFDPALDANGRSSVGAGTIEDDHRVYFRVVVPAELRENRSSAGA